MTIWIIIIVIIGFLIGFAGVSEENPICIGMLVLSVLSAAFMIIRWMSSLKIMLILAEIGAGLIVLLLAVAILKAIFDR